jgi:hypothetical protein
MPQEWAEAQYNLGLDLGDLAKLSGGPRAAGLLGEAAAAFKCALEVRGREQQPQKWAGTEHCLGITLCEQARLSGGPQAPGLLSEGVAALDLALEAYAHEQLPQQWALAKGQLGGVLQMYFAMNEFRVGRVQLHRLMREKHIAEDSQFVVLIHVLEILCDRALGEEGPAGEALDTLVAHIERQPEPFRIPPFSWLRGAVEQSKVEAVVASRDFMIAVLDAVSKEDRQGVLDALRRVQTK